MEEYGAMSHALGDGADGSAPKSAPSFELTFRPSVELISVVRRFVMEFYQKVLQDHDASGRLALATHELLENAAKYSTDGEAMLCVTVDRAAGTVLVRTTNRATPGQREALRTCFEEIAAAPDAGVLYAQMLRRSAVKTTGSGGLGLARIWAESDMALNLAVDGDTVEIQARGPITTAG
jgi:hypothetical protein